MRYSVSKLNTYINCPKLFKFCIIDRRTTIKNSRMARGSYIHGLLEKYPDIDSVDKGELSEAEAFAALLDFKNMIKNTNLLEFLKIAIAREQVILFDKEFNITDNQEIAKFKGVIDLIGKVKDRYLNLDWKTGKSKVDRFQLEMYAAWSIKKFNLDSISSSYFYVDLNKKENFVVNKSEVELVIEKAKRIIKEIESDEKFLPKRNPNCKYCDFFNECI